MTGPIPSCNPTTRDISYNRRDSQRENAGTKIKTIENSDVAFASSCSSPDQSQVYDRLSILTNPARSAFLDMSGKNPVISVTQKEDRASLAAKAATVDKTQSTEPVNTVKTDSPVKNTNKPLSAKIRIILKKIKDNIPMCFVVITTVILTAIAVAGTFSLSFPLLFIASSVVTVLYVLWRVCNADKKEWVTIVIGSWASNKPRNVQNIAAGFIAAVSAKIDGADFKTMWLAGKFIFKKSKSVKNWGFTETNMACANATGRSVARVQELEGQKDIKASKASYAGAMAGASVGTKINEGIEGSSKIGEIAGTGAFHGAIFGRDMDSVARNGTDLASAVIHSYWRFWLPEVFPSEERPAVDDDRLSRSAHLNKHDEGNVTALVNSYWRLWLHDVVAPAQSQRNAFAVDNDVTFLEKDELANTKALWRESRESPSIVHGRVNKAMPAAQRTNPVKDRMTDGEVNPGLGEWLGAYTGGIVAGISAGVDKSLYRRFRNAALAIGKEVSAVRNIKSASAVASRRNNPAFPEID